VFPHVSSVNLITNSRCEVYRATLTDGTDAFLKVATDSTDEWSRDNLAKERDVYQQLSLDDITTPRLLGYEEYDGNTVLTLSAVEFEDIPLEKLTSPTFRKQLLEQFAGLINSLSNHDIPELDGRRFGIEFYRDRLGSQPQFNDSHWNQYQEIISDVADELIYRYESVTPQFVHGDLFYPNIGFDTGGNLVSVIDWEMAGRFDPMYDAAFLEAMLESFYCGAYTPPMTDQIRNEFREILTVSQSDCERIDLYKVWPQYIGLESVSLHGETGYIAHNTPGETVEHVYIRQQNLLDETIKTAKQHL